LQAAYLGDQRLAIRQFGDAGAQPRREVFLPGFARPATRSARLVAKGAIGVLRGHQPVDNIALQIRQLALGVGRLRRAAACRADPLCRRGGSNRERALRPIVDIGALQERANQRLNGPIRPLAGIVV
jgi:hypothetical protein